jgi:hypothetical protein
MWMPWWTSPDAGLAWLVLAWSVDQSPRSRALVNQVRYTSKVRIAQNQYTQRHIFTSGLNSGGRVGLASWLCVTLGFV